MNAQNALIAEVLAELVRAVAKFPTWPTDPLHALAVVGEEFGEMQKATLQAVYEPHKATPADVRAEAIQTAAVALRFLISLDAGAYRFQPSPQHHQAALEGEHGARPTADPVLDLAERALRAVRASRSTPIVDDDFPEMLHKADTLTRDAIAAIDRRKAEGEIEPPVSGDLEIARELWDRGMRADGDRPGVVCYPGVFDYSQSAGAVRLNPAEEVKVSLVAWAYMRGAIFGIGSHKARLPPLKGTDALVREYIEARDVYEAAKNPPGRSGFAPEIRLSHGDPIVIRYRDARAALAVGFLAPFHEGGTVSGPLPRIFEHGAELTACPRCRALIDRPCGAIDCPKRPPAPVDGEA